MKEDAILNVMQKVRLLLKKAIIFYSKIFLGVNAVIFGVFIGFVAIALISTPFGDENDQSISYDDRYEIVAGESDAETTLVSLPISGIILGDSTEIDEIFEVLSAGGITYGYDIKEELRRLAEDSEVDGVVLEINSPGGTIFGSKAIADGIAEYQESTGKPVTAYIGSMAASGGYWAAVGADEIIADSGTSIGSVGVITGPIKYYDGVISESGGALIGGVETTNGVTSEYITAGRGKDLGNPYRQLTEEERALLQQSVNTSYDQFVAYVALERGVSVDVIKNNWGAFVYNDVQALEKNLIDTRGTQDSAYVATAIAAGGTEDDFAVYAQRRHSGLFDRMFGVISSGVMSYRANQLSGNCVLSQQVLAYHGDLDAFCIR